MLMSLEQRRRIAKVSASRGEGRRFLSVGCTALPHAWVPGEPAPFSYAPFGSGKPSTQLSTGHTNRLLL